MKDLFIILHHLESDRGDDIVRFSVPSECKQSSLITTMECKKSELSKSDYRDMHKYTRKLLNQVAIVLNGTWGYVAQCGCIDIKFN